MRVFSRVALVILAVVVFILPAAMAQQTVASCPLTLVANNPATLSSQFYQSPHGVFRFGSQVFVLRGQNLTTYTVTDLGDMQVAREDPLNNLAARESNGGVAFANGILYVSSEAGLEIFDLTNVRAGGTAPRSISRTPGLHYRRLAVSGNLLAALFPATDLPCWANGTAGCFNTIDFYNVANTASPFRVGTLTTLNSSFGGFNDIAFNFGFLAATGNGGTFLFNVTNPNGAFRLTNDPITPGTFLVSNGANLLAVGNETQIVTYSVTAAPFTISPMFLHSTPALRQEHSNRLIFHPQATFDEAGSRLITMIDELDPQTLRPARTIAFDVFDYGVPMFEGSAPRVYEQVSFTTGDEVKWNPTAVGSLVYTVGELTGVQTYGSCGLMTGKIEFDTVASLPCGGAYVSGWVTGATKIANVELFLDGTSLGPPAPPSGAPRTDITSTTPVSPWRVGVNFDTTPKGDHVLRAVGTDANGNRRQFASQRVTFPGPGSNCFVRKRAVLR
jgi:hypothetical protein